MSKSTDRNLNVASILNDKLSGEKEPCLHNKELITPSTLLLGQLLEEFLQSKYKEKLKSDLIQPTFIKLLNLMKPVVLALSLLLFMLILVSCSVLFYLVKVT